MDPVDLLLEAIIGDGGAWPPKREVPTWRRIRTFRAFLESDRGKLRKIADWKNADRPYKVDPLPERMADARGDFLWGEDPVIRPANEADVNALEFLLEGNEDLVGDWHSAERAIGGEGEQWWRIYTDTDVADVPLLEWHSRDAVFPLYIGRRLMAVALVTELERNRDRGPYWRHLEIHVDGAVEHVLFRGSKARIGETRPLEEHPETAELAAALTVDDATMRAAWDHGLPMLMGRLRNNRRRGNQRVLGVSDFAGIEDFLLDLNEAVTVGGENMRLTAKRRVVVPLSAVQTPANERIDVVDRGDGSFVPASGRPLFDAGEDVLVADPADAELGRDPSAPFKVLEYTFDAEPLIAWKRDLVETALTRVGITPQWVGVRSGDAGEGLAISGTALRYKLLPTSNAGRRWARPWTGSTGARRILSLMAQVDALAVEEGGFGRSWTDPTSAMVIELANPLPIDEVEEAQVDNTLVTARLRSRKTAIKRQHPEWTDAQVQDELDEIDKDAPPAPTFGPLPPAVGG